ncbi:MAG: SDR family oxidoreductase [Candidatus Saccharimonadales bacterium]
MRVNVTKAYDADRKSWALVTGASGGIGLHLAENCARKGINVIIVSRNESLLQALRIKLEATYAVSVRVIAADLSQVSEVKKLIHIIQDENYQVDYLINNAGFGGYGNFLETKWAHEYAMIELNVVALTYLCKSMANHMVARGHGKILNVASIAGFLSGPNMAVYYASKAFVLHFSEALTQELRSTGVTVTTLCPGPTATKFANAAQAEASAVFKNKHLPTPDQVAAFGFSAMLRGKQLVIYGWRNRVLVILIRFFPRQWIVRAVGRAQSTKA